ncbi:DUF554 domain-containing protein [Bacillus massilinigeriensis]|uniref:DUF554 domain-containing protein n=1 Tax=Bacillus mediterraneensis TaxID=1805474 RepID=UPI0008F94A05|nr:DUF554 domain-containing protein [Bacillus mediterraneensis]
MFLLGTIVNGILIVIGTVIGRFLHRIPENMRTTILYGIGLSVIVLGLQMGFKSENYLIVILSLVAGSAIGEYFQLEERLNATGNWIERKVGSSETGSISQGFVTATLIFVIGAMAIIGALDSGIRGDHDVLYTKAVIDGFTALVLATTLGIGVIFSAVPVILYEGTIAIFATQIDRFIPKELMDSFILELTATGGLMIFALGLNLVGLTKIRVANMLPGIAVTAMIVFGIYCYDLYF